PVSGWGMGVYTNAKPSDLKVLAPKSLSIDNLLAIAKKTKSVKKDISRPLLPEIKFPTSVAVNDFESLNLLLNDLQKDSASIVKTLYRMDFFPIKENKEEYARNKFS